MTTLKPADNASLSAGKLPALILGLVSFFCLSLLAVVWWLTEDSIQQSEATVLAKRLQQIVPAELYDNDPGSDVLVIETDSGPITIYRARMQQHPVAAIFDVTTGAGYAGAIRMLVGVYTNGEVSAVRILSHSETPGLGDDIEISRSEWINGFTGKSLAGLSRRDWQVKKDGGRFDQFTGATITPRAVVNAVFGVLRVHRQQGQTVFQ